MKRGRKKKFKLRFDIKAEATKSVLVVILLISWLVSFVSFFAPEYSLNSRIYHFWRGAFGGLALFAPLFLVLIALFFISSVKTKFKEPRIVFGISLLYLALLSFLHALVPAEKAYDVAIQGDGGGYVGYTIASLLISAVSKTGALAILIGSLIISVIVLFNVSLDGILSRIPTFLASLNIFAKLKLLKKDKELQEESSVEVSSGIPMEEDGDSHPIDYLEEKTARKVPKPALVQEEFDFEVVPSLSEPEGETLVDDKKTVNTLITDAKHPGLPYVDSIWKFPPLELLPDYGESKADVGDIDERGKKIKETLRSFDIDVEIADIKPGPSVTQYSLKAESGVKISKIASYQNDIALALSSPTGSVRIEAPIPGKPYIGIEVPNNTRALVSFKSLITADSMKETKSKLAIALGKDVSGRALTYDIGKMPHMLIAGTTGSGKSIFIHNILFSILYRANPTEVKFILIDPKRVELIHYQDIPHLYTPVLTDMTKAPAVFNWIVSEMERRYVLFERARARNIEAYNKESGFQALPYIVVVVEELGEIMATDPNSVERSIIRLAQLARATGIHLVLTVQRPDTRVITGLIKANIPCRVAFNVMSQIDSRVIIDQPGAEKLLGKGDMLFIPPDMSRPIRLQGALVEEKEVKNLVAYLQSQGVAPEYRDDIFQTQQRAQNGNSNLGNDVDELFDQAVDIVSLAGKASASLLQRKLSIGYARAARIMDELEQNGIIGPADGQKPRDVLINHNPTIPGTTNKFPADEEPDSEVNSIQL